MSPKVASSSCFSLYVVESVSAADINSSSDAAATLGFFRCCFGPNVEANDSVSTIFAVGLSVVSFSFNKDIGNLLRLRSTWYELSFLSPIASLKCVNASCAITLVLPNHLLFGSTLATGASVLCKSAALMISPLAFRTALPCLYMFKCLIFFASR
ncbi:conserved hypothetical protein [Lodderomyces elongisporus NRRL YB-4239]|uniref:Uncharacterized protein n=1 Tax=Lodderomyces elongisporus (strain ATCC 11503 / CBS 2605 / JCM 1781 / NBRC 1676 / NRRL YB-4239) TaxID=379508 RepID=A5E5V9_LODEL|nr:conserved hypothetical protein [Lodderomyces elongisporus NRRL YB-4239]